MPRFVILIHDHPVLHWDFLLEDGDHCRAWRLLAPPDTTSNVIPAEPLVAHRTRYLDYEGPVSGNRGQVTRWDAGTFQWQVNRPELCEVLLAGTRWNGIVRLLRDENLHWVCKRDQ
jgi:hypothetical protein